MASVRQNRYSAIVEAVFHANYRRGQREVAFERQDIIKYANELSIETPKNLGDLIYSFRDRTPLPSSILATATATAMRGAQPPAGDLIRRCAGPGALTWMMRLEGVQRQRGAHRNRLDHRPDRLENLRRWTPPRHRPEGDPGRYR